MLVRSAAFVSLGCVLVSACIKRINFSLEVFVIVELGVDVALSMGEYQKEWILSVSSLVTGSAAKAFQLADLFWWENIIGAVETPASPTRKEGVGELGVSLT